MYDGPTEHVFLDSEVFVHFGFQYSSTALKVLAHLVKLGRLTLVITDVVIREVEGQIDKAIRSAHNAHKKFTQEHGRVLGSSGIKDVADKIVWFDRNAAVKDLQERFHKFLKDNKTIVIKTANVSIAEILDDYFAGKHPFGVQESKPEFPDAVNVKALIARAEADDKDMRVVSGDKGVRDACDETDRLTAHETVQEMLDNIASDEETLAEFVRNQIEEHDDEIKAQAIHQFEDRYFYVEDENGDAEVQVTDASLEEVEVLELSDDSAVADVSYDMNYTADATYDDPDRVSYDSETGTSIAWGSREDTVHRSHWIRAEVKVSFDGLDPEQFKIESVTVTSPKDAVGVKLYEDTDYK